MTDAGPEAFDDAVGVIDPATLRLLGGSEYKIGFCDGELVDASRARRIRFRARFPVGLPVSVPVILVSPGGTGGESGHTAYAHFGTLFARVGSLRSTSTTSHPPTRCATG